MLLKQNLISLKREAFNKKTAFDFKEAYKKQIRKSFIKKSQNFYFQSQIFQKFNQVQSSQNMQWYFDKIFDSIEQINLEEISDEQADYIATDLIYLIVQKDFICPYHIKLKKNQSASSTLVIAYISNKINPQQLKYWIQYMTEQERVLVYSNISSQDQSSRIWIEDQFFTKHLLLDWNLRQVPQAVISLLQESVYINQYFIQTINQRLMKKIKSFIMNKSQKFVCQQFQILIYLIKLFKKNQSPGIRILQLYLNQLIQNLSQDMLSQIMSQKVISLIQSYLRETNQTFEITLIQQNFVKLMQVLSNNLKKVNYLLIDNKSSQKILISEWKMILNICLYYLRVNKLRKTGFLFKNKQILQKINPSRLKKQLTQQNLEEQIQKVEKIFQKIQNLL